MTEMERLTKRQREVLTRKKEGPYPSRLFRAINQLIAMKYMKYVDDEAPGTVALTPKGKSEIRKLMATEIERG